MTGRIESIQLDVDELRRLRDERDTLQDAVISRDITIETLRQRVNALRAALADAMEVGSHLMSAAAHTQARKLLDHDEEPAAPKPKDMP